MHQRFIQIALLSCVIVFSGIGPTFALEPGKQTESSVEVKVKGDQTVTLKFLVFAPKSYGTSDRKWPLLMFLHGAGARGDDLLLVKKAGPPKIVETKPDFPFLVISPQCPTGQRWDPARLEQLLDHVVSQYRVDSERIYLTGLSMGGFGCWEWAAAHSERFAAVVPICGGGELEWAKNLKNTPLWVFHGEKDGVVPIERSRQMVDALKAIGGNVKFTAYPDADHDSWTVTYDNPQLYEWLLLQRRKKTVK